MSHITIHKEKIYFWIEFRISILNLEILHYESKVQVDFETKIQG